MTARRQARDMPLLRMTAMRVLTPWHGIPPLDDDGHCNDHQQGLIQNSNQTRFYKKECYKCCKANWREASSVQ